MLANYLALCHAAARRPVDPSAAAVAPREFAPHLRALPAAAPSAAAAPAAAPRSVPRDGARAA